MRHYYSGKFTCKNPQKYKGDATNIIYRSGWERKFYSWLDSHPHVLEWNSEELAIPYLSPVDGKMHRYFPDCWMKMKTKDGIKSYLVEIKPLAQTRLPKPKKRQTKKYIKEVATFAVNDAKWASAVDFCKLHGWTFKVITENELYPANK
jgi:hypothetical protein